ncbi:MAG: 50S ribosomal protein L25 [Myxococcales bacterium]|nr:50S ribosomal protein L25 [Myxococcales bacterium]MDD9967650.1 50S ribosomal protein L25 [Myxococcales bacterium]
MEAQTLATEARTPAGKGGARQLRQHGRVPAVLYGAKGEAVSISVSPKDLTAAITTPYRRNQLLKLRVDGKEELAVVQDLQVDPLTRAPMHVDFMRVQEEQTIRRPVPLVTSGRAVGVVAGGDLRVLYRSLPVVASPARIPDQIHIDVTPMQVGDVIRVKDLKLEEGVRVPLPEERNVVTVTQSRRRAAKDGEGEEKAE